MGTPIKCSIDLTLKKAVWDREALDRTRGEDWIGIVIAHCTEFAFRSVDVQFSFSVPDGE